MLESLGYKPIVSMNMQIRDLAFKCVSSFFY